MRNNQYNISELRVLWYLKKNGPMTGSGKPPGILSRLSEAISMRQATVGYSLQNLEKNCIVLRTYRAGRKSSWDDKSGFNPMIRLELVDPKMYLPPEPPPMPLAVVVAHENEELYERTYHEPDANDIVEALLNRITELQSQVDKLQDIVAQQADLVAKVNARKERPEHLSNRIKDALTSDQWEKLTHR